MSGNADRIQLYLGSPIDNAAETACLRRVREHLASVDTDAILLANFTLGPKRRQIDLVIATATTAVVVEIKGYIHPVNGEVNGPWALALDDGSERGLGATNPYNQALANRFAVTDALRSGAVDDDVRAGVAGMLCLFPAPVTGSTIPPGDFKVAIGGYPELTALLATPRPGAISLDRWHAFAASAGLTDASVLPPNAGASLVAEYRAAFDDLARATAGPYVEPLFEGDHATAELSQRIRDGGQLQLVGPSGSGKTELLKALARATSQDGNLALLIRAGDFEKQFARLLRAAVARCSSASTISLFASARQVGAEIILFVDGINECPPDRRADLIGALQGVRINYGARIILTGQDETLLPTSLAGDAIKLVQPDHDQAGRLVAAHLGRALADSERGALEVVATANDAAVLAAVLSQPLPVDGRFALYDSFTRARLAATGDPQAGRPLSILATAMRSAFVGSMPRAKVEAILDVERASTTANACASGLLRAEGARMSFRHELIGDFFAADGLLRRARTPADLDALARLPINAELREFLLGGCATMHEIEALIGKDPDPRLLRAALAGRAGEKARRYVLDRLRDLVAHLARRYATISLKLPDGVTSARELHSFEVSFPDGLDDDGVDAAYLRLLPLTLGDGLLDALLDMFAAVDVRLFAEAERLRALHSDVRMAWRAAAYGSIYGMHFQRAGQALHTLLNAIQNAWAYEAPAVDLNLRRYLDNFEALGVGQMFLLVAALRTARNEPLPSRFPELVRAIWRTQVYHLRLHICDIIRFRGGELSAEAQEAVRDDLNSWLSDDGLLLNSIIIDALEGVEGLEITMTVEAAVEEFEALLALPETPESCKLAVSAVTSTYDHPFRDIYWEAFYDVLAVEKRQALLLRGLRDTPGDPWFIEDILRALRRDPTAAAAPELQTLAHSPRIDGHSHQHAVHVYADAIAMLASLGIPLDPPPQEDPVRRAWEAAAPLIYQLNDPTTDLPAGAIPALVACGSAPVFDVVQRLAREARNYGHQANVAFETVWPDLVRDLCRAVLAPGYVAVSLLPQFRGDGTLTDEHVDFALAMIAKVGRATDVKLVASWLDHPRHGERALAAGRSLESAVDEAVSAALIREA